MSNVHELHNNTGQEEGDEKRTPSASDPKLDQAIAKAFATIDQLVEERAEINAKIAAEVQTLEAQFGLNRHAVRYVLQYRKMAEDKRETLDLSYFIARRAAGAPVQSDMFLSSAAKPDAA